MASLTKDLYLPDAKQSIQLLYLTFRQTITTTYFFLDRQTDRQTDRQRDREIGSLFKSE
jgi:hypothetical protein